MEKLKRINFKQPKYILPTLCLVPVIVIVWFLVDAFSYEVVEDAPYSLDGAVNVSMPDANLDKSELKTKYENLKDEYSKVKDHSAIQIIENEGETEIEDVSQSLYSDEEIKALDSLEIMRAENMKMLEELKRNVTINTEIDKTTNNVEQDSDEMLISDMQKQMEMLQRIASGEKILTPAEEEAKRIEERARELMQAERDKEVKVETPEIVTKAENISTSYFNTINRESKSDDIHIKAMLDETIKVVDGSRIRIKLMDDIMIEQMIIKKGTYIYATISGFGNQRVRAKVEAIMVNGQRVKVALNLYDNDGLEGFYVPASAFRDLTKDAGAGAMNQNINMNTTSGEQTLESFAMQTLGSIYTSTTSAVSKNIKKNKAKLKYNTEVYLINE